MTMRPCGVQRTTLASATVASSPSPIDCTSYHLSPTGPNTTSMPLSPLSL